MTLLPGLAHASRLTSFLLRMVASQLGVDFEILFKLCRKLRRHPGSCRRTFDANIHQRLPKPSQQTQQNFAKKTRFEK
jgi:hypothetical protein